MQPLVTVAIAAYNVEKYLNTGMESILKQSYANLEILLVDDGSTDNTPTMCDELAIEDSRIHVIHKENGGLGSARNVGIDLAKGEYLYFFDVDDSLALSFIEDSVNYAQQKKADLLIYGYYVRYSNSNEEELIEVKEKEIHNNSDLKRVYCKDLLWMKHGNGFAWNKFYRMSFLKKYGFRFGNQRIQQDEPFNLQLYPKLEHVYVCPLAYYQYVIYSCENAGSRFLPDKADIITDVYHKFTDFYQAWSLNDDNVLRYIRKRYVSGMFGVVTVNFFHKDCPWKRAKRYRYVDSVLHQQELRDALRMQRIDYGHNVVNNLQAWAFNHGRTGLLLLATHVKRIFKTMLGE